MAGTIGATISYALTATNDICGQQNTSHLSPNHIDSQHHHNSIALPFTIGGFLYIALVGIVPEIVEEEDRKISLIQLASFISGVIFIYLLVQVEMNLAGFAH
jgi:zinc transporter ZupT